MKLLKTFVRSAMQAALVLLTFVAAEGMPSGPAPDPARMQLGPGGGAPGREGGPAAVPLPMAGVRASNALEIVRADRARSAALSAPTGGRVAAAERAVAHARRALRDGPASGYAWLMLAWGEALAGRTEEAVAAIEASWRWAPVSANLAHLRTLLASRLWADLPREGRETALAEMPRARLAGADFRRAVQSDPAYARMARRAERGGDAGAGGG